MAVCPSYRPPIRSNRRMVRMGLESEYGIPALELSAFPLQEAIFPLQPAVTMTSRHEDNEYADEPIPMESSYPIEGMTYIQYAQNRVLPDWTKILEIAGFPQDYDDEHDRLVFAPGAAKSSTIDIWYGELMHRATGARSVCSIRAEVGQPLRCEFSMRGLYNTREVDTSIIVQNPLTIPPLFRNIDFTITPEETGIAITPIVKNMSWNIGTQLRDRMDDNGEDGITEIMIEPLRSPMWTCIIEANTDEDWITYFMNETLFDLHLTMYDESSSRMIAYTPLGYTAKLSAVPTYGDSNGVTVQELQFSLMQDRYLELELL